MERKISRIFQLKLGSPSPLQIIREISTCEHKQSSTFRPKPQRTTSATSTAGNYFYCKLVLHVSGNDELQALVAKPAKLAHSPQIGGYIQSKCRACSREIWQQISLQKPALIRPLSISIFLARFATEIVFCDLIE